MTWRRWQNVSCEIAFALATKTGNWHQKEEGALAHMRKCATLVVTSPTTSACMKRSNFLNTDRHKTRIVQLLFTWRPFSTSNFHSCRRHWRNNQVWMHWGSHTPPRQAATVGWERRRFVCLCRIVEGFHRLCVCTKLQLHSACPRAGLRTHSVTISSSADHSQSLDYSRSTA